MPIMFKDGQILFVGGAIAMSEDCCCDADPCVDGECVPDDTGLANNGILNLVVTGETVSGAGMGFGFNLACVPVLDTNDLHCITNSSVEPCNGYVYSLVINTVEGDAGNYQWEAHVGGESLIWQDSLANLQAQPVGDTLYPVVFDLIKRDKTTLDCLGDTNTGAGDVSITKF